MLLVTLVLGIACLSWALAAPVSGYVQQDQFQRLQEKVDRMQMKMNELELASVIPKSRKKNNFVTHDIFCRFLSKDKIH